MSSDNGQLKESLVAFQTSQGVEVRASLARLTRYLAVLEIYNPALVLRSSEAVQDFRIIVLDRTIYCGRAVVSSLVNTGTLIIAELKLEETGFLTTAFALERVNGDGVEGFHDFLSQWQKVYKVKPEFKVVVADMQTFLMDLRLWLDQLELEIRGAPAGDRAAMERDAFERVGEEMVPAFNAMHERLESVSGTVEEDLRPVHQNFAKRQLHPLVMCSPFAYRTFHKPLGYAGDYEMVNMIVRDPFEGSSLFAKVLNLWFLRQWPAKAHRNRIEYLKQLLITESLRGARRGKPIRVLNLGCGPAREIQEFLQQDSLPEHAQFTLLDFNEETIQFTTRVLSELKNRFGRRTPIQIQKKSVQHVLKEGAKPLVQGPDKLYDLIYCAGLFDYLPNRTCKQLLNIFYEWLAPGGLVVATNVDDCKPFRHMLEFVLDWHLIYRDGRKGPILVPDQASPDNVRTSRDPTGVNVFIETRKPDA